MDAILALEDGTIFKGTSFGAEGECSGEVIFNTSMTGYVEILTDPSYEGQIVTMTYPLIGNYGITAGDSESARPCLEGFVIRERSQITSSWRAESTLAEFLKINKIVGIEGIDTRELTLHIREAGAMKAVLSTVSDNQESLVRKARESPGLVGRDLVKDVSSPRPFYWTDKGKYKVVVIDCGAKYNILRELADLDCKVYVMPADSLPQEIIAQKPDGILLSNGPGDPAPVGYVIATVKKLLGRIPIFGICLGHQILGLALGGRTYKLKFGHHGANHPVKDLRTGSIMITVQNHGFCVDVDSLPQKEIEITHINLNDSTLEGMRHKKLPVFSVQFHPEAAAGPHDARYLFAEFIEMMGRLK
ncbi:MAG: glutamine-hydrolyzing carbamoyl-phosphate synthase small subunit [Candidatus Omnitrophota bacterium]